MKLAALPVLAVLAAGSATAQQTSGAPACAIDFAALGVTAEYGAERAGLPPDSADMNLRALVLRFTPSSSAEPTPDGPPEDGAGAVYREVILIYHLPAESLAAEIAALRGTAVAALGEPVSVFPCVYDEGDMLVLYAPFLSNLPEQGLIVGRDILVSMRDVVVTEAFGEARLVSQPMSEVLPREGEPWVRNFYPWITTLDFRPTGADEAVFAVEQVTCDQRGNLILGTRGHTVAALTPEAIRVVPDALLAANAYFGASGDPTDEDTVAESVNATRYWCLPKREFCHEEIPFGDFGLKVQKGFPKDYAASDVVSLRHGLVPALQSVIMSYCPPDPKEAP